MIVVEWLACAKQVNWQSSEIIVNIPHEHCPKAHLKEEPLETAHFQLWVSKEHHKRDDEHESAMEDITEHDSELEWECDAIEQCWVDFFVPGHALSVSDHLCELSPLILSELTRWR